MKGFRRWVNRWPRLALATVYVVQAILWLLCVLFAFVGGFQGFKDGWYEDFSDMWHLVKRDLTETMERLRQAIASRKKE